MRRIDTVCCPEGTPVRVYSPLELVTAPRRVPSTVTCASARPRPLAASVTRPRTLPVVACAVRSDGVRVSATASAVRARRTEVRVMLLSPISGFSLSPVGAGAFEGRRYDMFGCGAGQAFPSGNGHLFSRNRYETCWTRTWEE